MLKKTGFLVFVHVFFCLNVFAQNFMHSIGANISFIFAKIETPYVKESFMMQVSHFSYFPRFTVMETENSSLSIGSPLGAGINLLTNNSGGGGVSWGYDLPLVVDYNIGCKSTPDNESGFGGYFGTGFSYLHTSYKLNSNETSKVKSYGPLARAGVRFSSGSGNWHTTVGIYYKIGLEKENFKSIGFNVLMDF